MGITVGSRVKIAPKLGAKLIPPFNHYAATGRVGTVTEPMGAGWRVAFPPMGSATKPRLIVLEARDIIQA